MAQRLKTATLVSPVELATATETLIVKNKVAIDGFNKRMRIGETFSKASRTPRYPVRQGRCDHLMFCNASGDLHPLHLRRHSSEPLCVVGKASAGIIEVGVTLAGFHEAQIDFVANQPGTTLFHCHQQLHMDFGFSALFEYA